MSYRKNLEHDFCRGIPLEALIAAKRQGITALHLIDRVAQENEARETAATANQETPDGPEHHPV